MSDDIRSDYNARIANVRANDLSTKEVASIAAYRSHFGMIEGLAREQTVQALEKSAGEFVSPKAVATRMAAIMRK